MSIKKVSFGNSNVIAPSDSNKNRVGLVSTTPMENDKYISPKSKKDDKTLQYALIGAGALFTIIAIINHKKIGESLNKLFSKSSKIEPPKAEPSNISPSNCYSSSSESTSTYVSSTIPQSSDNVGMPSTQSVIQKGAERISDILSGKASSEELAEGARRANAEARRIAEMRQKFPELLVNREERSIKFNRNKEKFKQGLFDLDYYKDEFRVNVTVPAERLRILKESSNPELKQMFDLDRKMFQINEGIMIHGHNEAEKKKLLAAFIEEAEKYDMDVVYIKAGDSDPLVFSQQVERLFPEAKQKFLTQKKHTVFVIEDADKMLALTGQNGPCRAAINVNTNNCGFEGVTWISTVKDISKLDESCYRGGRVSQVIDIDDAIKLSK